MEPVALSRDGSKHVTNEIINTVSHLAAACFALLGSVLLVTQASAASKPWSIAAFSIYGLSLVALFTFSTLHHGLNSTPRANQLLRTLDYASIFTLIGGTVTPIALILYRNIYGWSVFGVVWAIAILGIVLRVVHHTLPKHITNTLFIVLGWLPAILVLVGGVALPLGALALLGAGGLLYSGGFVLFVAEKPNPKPGVFGFHEIWHILVALAALCHYLFMYIYVLPK
jgi:hemolysin III